MSQNIRRDIESAYKVVQTYPDTDFKERRLLLLDKLEIFISKYPWDTGKHIENFRRYGKLSTEDFSRLTGISKDYSRQIFSRCSSSINKKLGGDKINTALYGDLKKINEAIKCINLMLNSSINAESLLLSEVTTKVGENRASIIYNEDDLSAEIEFLKKYSKIQMGEDFAKINRDKLSFCLKVLNVCDGSLIDLKSILVGKLSHKK